MFFLLVISLTTSCTNVSFTIPIVQFFKTKTKRNHKKILSARVSLFVFSFMNNKKITLSHEKLGFWIFFFLFFVFFDEKKDYYINFSRLKLHYKFSQSSPHETLTFLQIIWWKVIRLFYFLILFTIRKNFWPKHKRVWKSQKRKIKSEENSSFFFFCLRKNFFTKHTQLRPNNSHENVKSEWGKVWRKFCVRIFSLVEGLITQENNFSFSLFSLLLDQHKQVWKLKSASIVTKNFDDPSVKKS